MGAILYGVHTSGCSLGSSSMACSISCLRGSVAGSFEGITYLNSWMRRDTCGSVIELAIGFSSTSIRVTKKVSTLGPQVALSYMAEISYDLVASRGEPYMKHG